MSELKILMADDHEDEISDARQLLESMDHEVDTATTYTNALHFARNNSYDIAVIDLGWFTDKTSGIQHDKKLVERGGFRIADEVRKKNPSTQLILYSSRIDQPEVKETAVKKHMLCIQKSFNETSRQSLASMVKAFAQLLSADDQKRMPHGQPLPLAYSKLEEGVRSFFLDEQNECEDYNKNVFIMTRFQPGNRQLEAIDRAMRTSLAVHGLRGHRADDRCYVTDRNLWDNVCIHMIGCRYGIAVLEDIIQEDFNPNVALEYGFMRGLGKQVLLLKERRFHPRADIMGTLWEDFDIFDIDSFIETAINRWVRDIGVSMALDSA
ncbi:response regulator [Thermodesulfobacteriota bacterium]